jgi:hypothetical protein
MEINQNLCANALRKVALLITKASDIGMDLSGYGQAAENPYSGNVYLWLEDYNFTLYIDLSGDDTITALWTDLDTGDEEITDASDMSLRELEDWAEELEAARLAKLID